jgi:protein gp37
VHLGVSVENQATADERVPILLETPAWVRFVSAEPLLERVDLRSYMAAALMTNDGRRLMSGAPETGAAGGRWQWPLDWVIAGGESGPGARPCALEWLEDIVEACRESAVPAFVKQLGSFCVAESRSVPADMYTDAHRPPEVPGHPGHVWGWRAGLEDRAGGDIEAFPDELRVRMFPGQKWAPRPEPVVDPEACF